MAQFCACDQCGFGIDGPCAAVCLHCFTPYLLPTANPYGAFLGEIIYLHKIISVRKTRHKKKGTEIGLCSFVATEEFIITEPYQPGRPCNSAITYPMEYLRCPTCASVGTIVIDLEDGPCPRCKVGHVHCHEVEY